MINGIHKGGRSGAMVRENERGLVTDKTMCEDDDRGKTIII